MSKLSILSFLVANPDQFKSLSPHPQHTDVNINNEACSLSVTVTSTSDNQVIKRKGSASVHLLGGSSLCLLHIALGPGVTGSIRVVVGESC